MRLLYFTRHYTGHDARWLRVLGAAGLQLAYLPLGRIDALTFRQAHPSVDLLASPELRPDAGTEALAAALPTVAGEWHRYAPEVVLAGPLTDAGYLAARIDPERTLMMSWAFDVLHEVQLSPQAVARLEFVLRCGAPLFADCAAIADRCDEIAGRPVPRGCTLPWGLTAEDRPAASHGWRARLGDTTAAVVLSVRGFDPVHSPLLLIDAFQRAHVEDPSLRLWVAGDGALHAETVARVAAAGLATRVRFLGHLDQAALAGCYAEADLYLAGSRSDGSSISLLQAMDAGLPCIVSDLPSNREWLGSEGGAYGHDVASFAAQLVTLARLAPAARAQLAVRNRAEVNSRADLAANLPRLLAALREVVQGAATPVSPVA
jgi:hypothetical protein